MSNSIIITGASRGIGYATAALFTQKNYRVCNISRNPCDIAGVTNICFDLAEQTWPEQAILEFAQSDSLSIIHAAAYFCKDTAIDLSPEVLDKNFAINITAPSRLNRILLPKMTSGSSIIFIGSTLSEKAVKNTASYCISKHAVLGLMRATCQDLDKTGIHTCCICPGFTDTEMLREHTGNNDDVLAMLAEQSTMHRLIEPEEIAEFIYFCSKQAVINGAVLHANLGQIEQ